MNLLGSAITAIKPRDDDTLFDRVNYYYSTIIIIVAAITLTAKQYVGQPIQCFVPAEFGKSWEEYVENYCFVYNTYWVRPREAIPQDVDDRHHRELIYYQWVPFLMALEAGFFYLPVIFWSQFNTKSGLNIGNMVRIVQKVDLTENSEREKAVQTICRYMEDSVKLQKVRREGSSALNKHVTLGLLHGTYLANMYLLTKLLYLFNVIGQFTLMNKFLGQNNALWGAHILTDIYEGRDWELSGNFPRIAMCDFAVRLMGTVQRYSVQCVLVVNMFNEKIFLFLYLWFVLVFLLTFCDMIRWAYRTKLSTVRVSYIEKYVKTEKEETFLFREYCEKIINADGIIVLRLISSHSNELITQEILQFLWNKFKHAVALNHVHVVPPPDTESINSQDERNLASLKRTFSIMGAHVHMPVMPDEPSDEVKFDLDSSTPTTPLLTTTHTLMPPPPGAPDRPLMADGKPPPAFQATITRSDGGGARRR